MRGRAPSLARVAGILCWFLPFSAAQADIWATGSLSQPRTNLAAAAAGGEVLFGGGQTDRLSPPRNEANISSVVDIYDTALHAWTTATLSEARYALAAVAAGGQVFFAGGDRDFGVSLRPKFSSVVDIYDTTSHTWSVSSLAAPRHSLAAAASGGVVFFGGGEMPGIDYESSFPTALVDIYDTTTRAWKTDALSQSRSSLAAASAGGKVFFAGGVTATRSQPSNVVDIYDTTAHTWTTATLSVPRKELAGVSEGGLVFFAGGDDGIGLSDVVDIYDTVAGAWTTSALPSRRLWLTATAGEGKVFFAGGRGGLNTVDIYDTITRTWTTENLPEDREGMAAAAWGDQVFFAGGFDGSGNPSAVVDIYTMPEPTSLLLLGLGALAITRQRRASPGVGRKGTGRGGRRGGTGD